MHVAAVGLVATATGTRPAAAGDGAWFTKSIEVGLAFVTNLAVHESGHVLIAEGVGAQSASLKFFGEDNGSYFLGLSTASGLPEDAVLTYQLGGEIAASYTFELALHGYRRHPTAYNRALLFFSGTDFFWYTLYAFYLAPEENAFYDPVGIRESTGFSRGVIVAAAATQLAANAWRVASGTDRVVPSFSFDRRSALLNLTLTF
ncbi:MAG: hypothetical protein ACOYXU_05940 [Nitrospirota bacterium]